MRSSTFSMRSREFEYLIDPCGGNGNDAIGVGVDVVAGNDLHVVDHDRHLDRGAPHPVLPGTHEPAGGPERVTHLLRGGHVSADPVDHGSGDAAGGGDPAHDAAPDGAVQTARIVDDDDAAGCDLVEEVADRAALVVDRLVPDGERPAGDCPAGGSPDPEQGPGESQRIQGVGHGGGGQVGQSIDRRFPALDRSFVAHVGTLRWRCLLSDRILHVE